MRMNQNVELGSNAAKKYVSGLVGKFFKILPMKESNEPTLKKYLQSLQREMIGCCALIDELGNDERYISLLAILQYFIEHDEDIAVVRTEVFKAINIIDQMRGGSHSGKVER